MSLLCIIRNGVDKSMLGFTLTPWYIDISLFFHGKYKNFKIPGKNYSIWSYNTCVGWKIWYLMLNSFDFLRVDLWKIWLSNIKWMIYGENIYLLLFKSYSFSVCNRFIFMSRVIFSQHIYLQFVIIARVSFVYLSGTILCAN